MSTEAERTVQERGADYGPIRTNFERIAGMWTAYLGHPVTAEDVALMMVMLKISREKNRHKDDNITDIEGYMVCLKALLQGEPS